MGNKIAMKDPSPEPVVKYQFDPNLYAQIDLLVQKDRETNTLKRTKSGEALRQKK